jgi:hypothetical protein
MDSLSDQLINQRIRNRLIEVCEWIVDYEKNPSIDPNGLMNFWYDFWTDVKTPSGDPVYSPSETRMLSLVGQAMDSLCNATPKRMPDDPESLKALFQRPEWQKLKLAAQSALNELLTRGRFSEDVEEVF